MRCYSDMIHALSRIAGPTERRTSARAAASPGGAGYRAAGAAAGAGMAAAEPAITGAFLAQNTEIFIFRRPADYRQGLGP